MTTTFGINIEPVDNEARPARWPDMSCIGLIGTAPEADANLFPLDTPVLVLSNSAESIAALGASGTLADAVKLVNAQLGASAPAAQIVVVRVAEGVDATETISAIVGDGAGTGIGTFLHAQSMIGVTPRLVMAPGFTSQREGNDANAVCAALPPVLDKLLAHACVDGPATTRAEALAWRQTLNSQRLIPVDPAVRVLDDGQIVVQPMSPAVLGIAVRRDAERGGIPSGSWANQPMYGVVGPSRPVAFSLVDASTEGQALLEANIGILARGGLAADAIADGGFVFVGTDNAGDDELWRFYNVTRMRDYMHLMVVKTLRVYLGRFNLNQQTVEAVLNTLRDAFSQLQVGSHILGFRVRFDPSRNDAGNVRLGRIRVDFEAEETPVLRKITVGSARYRPAVDALIADLASA